MEQNQSPEVDSHLFGPLICNKAAKQILCTKNNLSTSKIGIIDYSISICKKNFIPSLISHIKINKICYWPKYKVKNYKTMKELVGEKSAWP